MKNILMATSLLFFLAGCATQETKVAEINMALSNSVFGIKIPPNLEKVKTYQSNPYLTSAVAVDPAYAEMYSSAMEAAIFKRNMEAVEYLVSINAPNRVSLRWSDPLTGRWQRTPVNVPVAEMACAMGEIGMMKYLQKSYPEDNVNYTNCLNFYVSSAMNTDPKILHHGHAGSVVSTIIELGADVNGNPDYGNSLHYTLLDLEVYTKLQETLLFHGLNANARYPCPMGECTHLTTLSVYDNAGHAADLLYLLLAHGADINISVRNRIEVDVLTTGELKYEYRKITPLHTAAYFSRPELYARLVDLGADETITDNLGRTPQQYAGVYHEFKKMSEENKRRYQAALAQQRQNSNSSSDFFGKAIAIGFGAVAMGSMDVSSDVSGKAFSAFTTDIITDSGGANLNQLNKDAMRELEQSQKSFNNDVSQISAANTTIINQGQASKRQPKAVDCGYEFIKARAYVRNYGGVTNNCKIGGHFASCNERHQRDINGLINTELTRRGLSQCQASLPPFKRVMSPTPKTSDDSNEA